MYLHIERSNEFHNSVKMMNDVAAACNNFIRLNDESIVVEGVEIYPFDGSYCITVATESLTDLNLLDSGKGYVEIVGKDYDWSMKGEVTSVETSDKGAVVNIENAPNIKMYTRD
ncbi:hypothetical protein M1M34_gp041 [Haloarcula tailed virus 2]|uniref:Uncharacterized protein n=1 Tax=Haloarcula tailed virus 2 TaxID=2877989 RepID=A0AAE8XYR5_9CAUD|nr:hypothetical protein M1M34_gp041 [Haloarcula tailed virus 2]UBF23192.1 hypothetical protein HATV-2_gp41 [Haloarcula tailed virus 2]